ncbi:Mitochondrial acidic MAM33 [Gossypium australe]|uniref:Mitochondrial acidic MAM33 n=1 Tax=Gossypium australe TaxID=47621 RepID=A0A5B6WGA4_9ROSI|nr:Mitochondrial acidic MAM33 [Gossypium australe]
MVELRAMIIRVSVTDDGGLSLEPQLQDALKEYLVARGIREDLTNFLLLTLHKKEQGQYLDWLRKLESFVAKDERLFSAAGKLKYC